MQSQIEQTDTQPAATVAAATAPRHIRCIALALIIRDDYILVGERYDKVADVTIYYPPGGGIEYGEYGEDAVIREFREEAGGELVNVRYLETFDDIFTFAGEIGHEMVRVYAAELAEPASFPFDLRMRVLDCPVDKDEFISWQPLTIFRSGEVPLLPTGLLDYIDRKV